jgi:hypothetical protein
MVIMVGTVVTGITHDIAVSVFLPGIVLVGAVILTVRYAVTIKVRSAACISIFITEQGRTGITGMNGATAGIAGVISVAEEIIIAGIVIEVV